VDNLSTNDKVTALLKGFQEKRRKKRREQLLRMFVELHEEFDELIPAIKADI
jgi:2-hydroxy-3-keto-5-methylthiopentenyl-1-phosphate phosphatase